MKDAASPSAIRRQAIRQRRETLIPLALRRQVNATLKLGTLCAALTPPKAHPAAPPPKVVIVAVDVPRNVRKAPRRGVFIPSPEMVKMRMQRVSKHARQKARFKGGRTPSWERPRKEDL